MKPSKLFWGITFVFLGGLWLAGALGYVNSGLVWLRILALWPLIFILVGLNLLIRDRRLVAFLGMVTLISAYTYAVYAPNNLSGVLGFKSSESSQSTKLGIDPTEKKLVLTVATGAVTLDIHEMTEIESNSNDLLASSTDMGSLQVDRTIKDGVATVSVNEKEGALTLDGISSNRKLTLLVSRNLPVELTVDSGAAKEDLDLSEIRLSKFTVKSGADSADIKFGLLSPTVALDLQTGASDYTISLPKQAGYMLTAAGGLTNVKCPDGAVVVDGKDTKTSVNYASAEVKARINVSAGLTNLTLKTY